jgi:soluble lytic murein transglycosylase-like protein
VLRIRTLLIGVATAALCIGVMPPNASAQIFSWRDAEGHLVLSDRPAGRSPAYQGTAVAVDSTTEWRTTRPATLTRAERFRELIEQHAADHGLNVDLLRAVIQVESGFNPRAVSPKGAMGLMQLMPATATEFGVLNPFDPGENIRAGSAYLRRLLDRYDGRVELALAAYNAGTGAVQKYGQAVPPYRETQEYVRKIKSVTPIVIGPRRIIYKIVEIIDGRDVPRYSDRKPAGDHAVVTRH